MGLCELSRGLLGNYSELPALLLRPTLEDFGTRRKDIRPKYMIINSLSGERKGRTPD